MPIDWKNVSARGTTPTTRTRGGVIDWKNLPPRPRREEEKQQPIETRIPEPEPVQESGLSRIAKALVSDIVKSTYGNVATQARAAGIGLAGLGRGGFRALRGDKEGARQAILEAGRRGEEGIKLPFTEERLKPTTKPLTAIGRGLETGSMFVGGGGAKTLATTGFKAGAKILAKQGAKPSLRTALKTLAKEGVKREAPAGTLFGLGIGLQAEKPTLGSVAKETALGTAGGVVGGAGLSPLAFALGKLTRRGARGTARVAEKEGMAGVTPQAAVTTPRQAPVGAGGVVKSTIESPVTPEQIPAAQSINKLIKALDDAVPLRGEQKQLYQKEMAKRTARVASIGEKTSGEAGLFAQLGQLKGELPKVQYEAIRKQFSQQEVDVLMDTIQQNSTLLPLEKVSAKNELRKMFDGVVPTPSGIQKLQEVFPKELIDAVLARRPVLEKVKNIAGDLWNLPRTIMASVDLSAPFRQGVFMIGRPKQFSKAFKDMFGFAVSEKAYQGLMKNIQARPTYSKMRQGGLALTEIGGPLSKREESFMSLLAEKIPIFGRLVRASNRAYTGFLNKLRADVFDDILQKATVAKKDVDDPLLKSLADFVNAGTGRGKFGISETGVIPKSMERSAVVLNGAFFSPRLMASRLNLLNPVFYAKLDPFVRKEALKTLFADTAIFSSLYGLWKLNGGEVGVDPRSADFGKLKMGNTRYDILGGFQQYIRLAAQLVTGEIVSSTTGRTITLGEGYKPLTRKDIIQRFFEYKTSPIASFILGLLQGQTAVGKDFDVPTEVINRFIPMITQDLYDISQEKGAEGLLYGLPAIFGVGVQTYGKQELVKGENKIGEQTIQIRPIPELAEKIRELVVGQLPLESSKGFNVQAYVDQLKEAPAEEANATYGGIARDNPELAKKIKDVIKNEKKGITVKDKDLKSKGVSSGDRALAVKKELDKLKTSQEKTALWNDYAKKGIITEDVAIQLRKILGL